MVVTWHRSPSIHHLPPNKRIRARQRALARLRALSWEVAFPVGPIIPARLPRGQEEKRQAVAARGGRGARPPQGLCGPGLGTVNPLGRPEKDPTTDYTENTDKRRRFSGKR